MNTPTAFERLTALRKSGQVVRWHVEPHWVGDRQNVGLHTFGVLLNLVAIADIPLRPELLKAALYHDLAEQAVGDVPLTTKIRLGLTEDLDELETEILAAAGFDPDLTTYEKRLLLAADRLEHCFVMTEQYLIGNLFMLTPMARILALEVNTSWAKVTAQASEIFCAFLQLWEPLLKNANQGLQRFAGNTVTRLYVNKSHPSDPD